MTKHKQNYFVDGSSINGTLNHSAYAIFKGKKIIKSVVLPILFNVYEIESMALLDGLIIAKENSRIFCDNQQIVNEVNGKKDPKDFMFCCRAKALMKNKNLKVLKIARAQNPAGIYLEKRIKKLKKKYLNSGNYFSNTKIIVKGGKE